VRLRVTWRGSGGDQWRRCQHADKSVIKKYNECSTGKKDSIDATVTVQKGLSHVQPYLFKTGHDYEHDFKTWVQTGLSLQPNAIRIHIVVLY
jgi:hypothetical protein